MQFVAKSSGGGRSRASHAKHDIAAKLLNRNSVKLRVCNIFVVRNIENRIEQSTYKVRLVIFFS